MNYSQKQELNAEKQLVREAKTELKGIIRCDACPVLCKIKPGRTGVCDRYANQDGRLTRVDPLVILQKNEQRPPVPFLVSNDSWDGNIMPTDSPFVTGIGATTTDRKSVV